MKRLILILGLLLGVKLPAQTISTSTVVWTTGWCNICGPTVGNYACETGSGSGNWNNGVRTFVDPSPAGHTVCSISVQVDKVDCGLTNMCVLLNGTLIQCQPVGVGTNCNCGACWPQIYQLQQCPFPNYVYGGINTLDLNPVGNLCVSRAIITVYSNTSCVNPCFVTLPIENLSKDNNSNIRKDYEPEIENITDLYGNDYKTTIPNDFKGVLVIRYKDGTYKKTIKIE